MIKNFVKILELLGDRLEVCVSVYRHCIPCDHNAVLNRLKLILLKYVYVLKKIFYSVVVDLLLNDIMYFPFFCGSSVFVLLRFV